MDKNGLRLRLKGILTAMTADERVRKSKALADNLLSFKQHSLLSLESSVIGVYAPLADEPDWTLSPKLCALKLAFPRCIGENQMAFFLCRVEELSLQKEFGVKMMVPPKEAPQVQPDVMLVPGLGFTEQGHRLGRGGGFYDRWLAGFNGKKIGLCFEEQLLQALPTESHDVVMDLVVTDKRVLSS